MKTIDVVLTLTSPLYIAYPDNLDKTENVSRTARTGFMVDGRIQMVPYYPANGFRGGLRRKAMKRIAAHLKATEGAISGDLYLGLSCGASSGSPDQTALSIEEILRARDNVYMGLFGGGARLHQSMYRVSDMLPIIQTTAEVGAIPPRYREIVKAKPAKEGDEKVKFTGGWELLGSRTSLRVDDLFRVINPAEILEYVNQPKETTATYQAAVLANREKRKGGDEGKADVGNMMGIETIAAGTPFHFRIDVHENASDDKIGLLLLGLEDIFRENAFGGWTRCGFGKVRVEEIALNIDGMTTVLNDLHAEEGVFQLPADAKAWTEAAEASIAALRIADLAPFFEDFSADAKVKKKADAKAKKAEKAGA